MTSPGPTKKIAIWVEEASRVTARDQPGRLFSCFLLDISQYTGERKRKDLELIPFWTREGIDRITVGEASTCWMPTKPSPM